MAVLQKVKRGDSLAISASTFNSLMDVAQEFQQRQRAALRRSTREQRDAGFVLVRNDSGADRERFDVLGITGPIIKRADNDGEFKRLVALRGDIPAAGHAGKFVVLLEPARDGAIVRACVDGVCAVRVRMHDEAHGFAEIAVGVADKLESAASGTARLLWVEPPGERDEPTIAWTIARVGGGGGPPAAGMVFAVITSRAGTQAPYRYTAASRWLDIDGNLIADPGEVAYSNVFNIEEMGSNGPWHTPLQDGDPVLLMPAPNDPQIDAHLCIRTHYRGTY